MDTLPDFDALWDYNKPAETEKKLTNLLPLAKSTGDASYLGQLLTQIARSQALQRKFAEAHQTLDKVEAILTEKLPIVRIRYLLERGRTLNSAGSPEKAMPLFEQAWELGMEIHDDFYAVDAAHMVAIVEKPEAALDWNLKALALAEKSRDMRAQKWLGSLYNNIGWTYHDMEDYEKALDIFQNALQLRMREGKPGPIRIARWCIARTLRSLNLIEDALRVLRKLLVEIEAAGEKDGYTHEELGECLLALGREAESQPHFARAFEILSQDPWLAANEPDRLARLEKLGKT